MESDISRRDFIKLLGLTGGAIFLAGCKNFIEPSPLAPTIPPTAPSTETATVTPTETKTPTPTSTEVEHFTTPALMLLGDSLIALGKVPTYLSLELEAAGLPVEFVGDRQTGSNTVPAEGHGGFNTVLMAQQLLAETTWTELNGTQIPNNFSKHIPDIVIIQLGTNDAINASEGGWSPIPTYERYMQKIVDYLRLKNPNVSIIIPRLIPCQVDEFDQNVKKLNDIIPDFVTRLNTENSRVVITRDLRDNWTMDDYLDIVHPNKAGQQKIAKVYFEALVSNNLLIGKVTTEKPTP
jgi:lysophospholipase L1-like esterase